MSQFNHISHKFGILSLLIILIFRVLRPALKSETIDLQQIFRPFFLYTGFVTAHRPVDTAQYSAMAMTKIKQLSFPGERSWLCVRPKPRDLKSLNMASIPHRLPYSRAVCGEASFDVAINHGSLDFLSFNIWMLVWMRRRVRYAP